MIPINPGYTPDELRYWLTDGDAEHLLIADTCLGIYRAMQAQSPVLAEDRVVTYGAAKVEGLPWWRELLAQSSPTFTPTEPVELDDIVNIQYTSGSTGWPKGCLLSHRYWLQFGKAASEAWPTFTRIQCDLPFYYMGPLWRFALAAFQGAALCVPPSYSLTRYRERMREYGYDMGWMTNPVAMLPPDPIERDNKLKMIAIFGLSKELHRAVEERYGAPVRESFGMTEIGFSIYMPFRDTHMSGSGSCGITAPFRELMIADPEGKPVRRGEIGELCVAGHGILQGYYKKPEATAAAFHGAGSALAISFGKTTTAYYYIVGRIKDMIRRSAENISVTEVETALSIMPAIQEVGRPRRQGREAGRGGQGLHRADARFDPRDACHTNRDYRALPRASRHASRCRAMSSTTRPFRAPARTRLPRSGWPMARVSRSRATFDSATGGGCRDRRVGNGTVPAPKGAAPRLKGFRDEPGFAAPRVTR